MKVVYNFIYSDSDGKIQEFKMPVSITEEIDADTMYDLCLSYLEVGKVKGTPPSCSINLRQVSKLLLHLNCL